MSGEIAITRRSWKPLRAEGAESVIYQPCQDQIPEVIETSLVTREERARSSRSEVQGQVVSRLIGGHRALINNANQYVKTRGNPVPFYAKPLDIPGFNSERTSMFQHISSCPFYGLIIIMEMPNNECLKMSCGSLP
jgi:hypothetical protein